MDVVGDIAIVRFTGPARTPMKRLAKALLGEVPNVRCVFQQEGGVEGEYRLRRLRHLAGEKRTLTLHRENGCSFKVDVRRCYFSPRLSTERLRVASGVKPRERVLNMFAGVGPFSILVAKRSGARVTSCELNRYACTLHEENDAINRVAQLVDIVNCDASELKGTVKERFDRILMPHPSAANRFLPDALSMAKSGGVIHYYRHVPGRNETEAKESLGLELDDLLPEKASYKLRRVREVGPRWLELAADISLSG